MKSKLTAFFLVAAGSAFAQSGFSISIGGYGPGSYAPPAYYGYGHPPVYRSYGPGGGAGYWGEDPERQHRRAEWRGLRNHQEQEREMYGNSPELWRHHAEERQQLRHEQWHERHGDDGAAYGPAHGSARDGYRPYGY